MDGIGTTESRCKINLGIEIPKNEISEMAERLCSDFDFTVTDDCEKLLYALLNQANPGFQSALNDRIPNWSCYTMLCRLAVMIFAVMSVSTVALNAAEPLLEDVAFTSTLDGSEQRYIQILPVDFQKDQSHDLLIALHGHGSDRWQFAQQTRDECRSSRDFAAKHQMIFISPDYRAKTSWMGPKAEADVVQIIQEFKKTQRIGKVLICGGSMGGTSALTFTALHPELVDGVAAMNGTANFLEYTQFQDAISESFGGAKATIPDEYKKRSAEYWPERFTMPVAIATGGQDELVPPHSCLRLAGVLTHLNRPVLLIHREQGGHNTNYADAMSILEFVREKAAAPKEQRTK